MRSMPNHARILVLSLLVAGCGGTASPTTGAIDRGSVDATEPVRLVIAVGLRAPVEPGAIGAPLSPSAFADRYAATPTAYRALVDWLVTAGLHVVRESDARTTITVEGAAAAVERAFHVRLHRFEERGSFYRAPVEEPTFPAGEHERAPIAGIVGLSDRGAWLSHRVDVDPGPVPLGTGRTGANTASDLQKLYGVSSVSERGDGETVAILGAGNPPSMSDVGGFVSYYGLPALANGQYSQVDLGGPDRQPDPNEYVENVLDVEMVLAMAPHATVVHVLTATNTPGLFSDGIAYIVDKLPQAHA